MKTTLAHVCVLVGVSVAVMFTNLGGARLWDRDEPRNAGCAREMLQRGDWIVPVFNGQLRHQKPVLLYWMMMGAYDMFGPSEWAARFWSATLSVGSVLLTYVMGRRLFSPRAGLVGGIVLATSLMFVVAGRAATPDALLIFFTTLALTIYVVATLAPHGGTSIKLRAAEAFPRRWPVVVALYAALGLGVLSKGIVGFVMPMAIIGMFMLIARLPPLDARWLETQGAAARLAIRLLRPFAPRHFLKTFWAMRPVTGVAVVLLVAAPWYLAVGIATSGEWTRLFFLQEHLGRATTALENHHGGIWYYPVAIALGFFPWSVLMAPLAIGVDRRLTRDSGSRLAYTFAVCWIGAQVVLFSFAQTKLPSYVTPCYPALAMLMGVCLDRLALGRKWTPSAWLYAAMVTLAVAGVLLGCGLAFGLGNLLPGTGALGLVGLVPLAAGITGVWLVRREKKLELVWTLSAAAVLTSLGVFAWGTQVVDRQQCHDRVLDAIPSDAAVGAFGCLESSWIYYGECLIDELAMSDDAANIAVAGRQISDLGPRPRVSPRQYFDAHRAAVVLTTDEHFARLEQMAGRPLAVIAEAPFFLRPHRLMLVTSAEAAARWSDDRARTDATTRR
jgi:4-amino-4-deoxy-L-arabinose transferase-like glycosyltransferase